LEHFNIKVPKHCPGINDDLLDPEKGWASKVEYHEALSALATEFLNNYTKKYKGKMGEYSAAIEAALPVI
jgi:ATP-dependent phosphoenolpyruvate carboxykinase